MKVKLIDVMGDDLRVVNAARVSFHKESSLGWYDEDGEWVEDYEGSLSQKDQKLIKYLADHNHFTPFTHTQLTFHLKMPIFVARQFTKHQVGFTTNEVSRRYVDDAPEFYTPKEWRMRAENKKQGSSDETIEWLQLKLYDSKMTISSRYLGAIWNLKTVYDEMIEAGVAPEQARMILPQSMYTEMYTTSSLFGWARFYKLRSDPHAQQEIGELAEMVNQEIKNIDELEYSWRALTDENTI